MRIPRGAADEVHAIELRGMQHADLVYNKHPRAADAVGQILVRAHAVDLLRVLMHGPARQPRPRMERPPVDVARRDPGVRRDGRLHLVLIQEIDILIEDVRLPRARRAGQEHILARLKQG